MPKATREEIRNRTVNPESLVDKKAVSLEEEAERIRAEIEKGESAIPTVADEIEAEQRQASLNDAHNDLLDKAAIPASKFAAFRNPKPQPAQQSLPVVHTKEVALIVESAYKQFLALGHGPETARSLASTYGLLELTIVLNKIAEKITPS